jgi:hypothetical protein
MSICDNLKNQMKDLTQKIQNLTNLYNAAVNAHNMAAASDAQQGIQIASQELKGLQLEFMSNGCAQANHPPPLPPIEILIVLDGIGTFGPTDPADNYFALTTVVATLTAPHNPSFHVTKAHRIADPQHAADPGFEDFKFDAHDLSKFDEIWLIGYDGPGTRFGSGPIAKLEIAAIAAFMNGGGGVFATGDHEDLGADLSGHVPRVRSMRKWFVGTDVPAGWPEAPTGLEEAGRGTPHRHDTLQPGHDAKFWFDNQSDDIPQPLQLVFKSGKAHPVMVGPNGNITAFPDHMHEGEVIVPWSPLDAIKVNDAPFDEYPDIGHGRPMPEIVAYGKVIGGHPTPVQPGEDIYHPSDSVPTVATTFGVVGAYDGHSAGVGRVLVDSTWHHFFDINLIGDPVALDAPKKQGFDATASGRNALSDIENYYLNIAMWLARGDTKGDWLSSVSWWLLLRRPFNELSIGGGRTELSAAAVLSIGRMARQALPQLVPEAQALDWLYTWATTAGKLKEALPAHPWDPRAPAETSSAVSHERVLEAALGGALVALARAFPRREVRHERSVKELRPVVEQGMRHGLSALAAETARQARALSEFAGRLKELV